MSYKFISYNTFKPHTVNIPNLGETELSFEKLYPEMQNTRLLIYKAKNNVEDPWVSRKMHFKVADTIPPERRANLIRLDSPNYGQITLATDKLDTTEILPELVKSETLMVEAYLSHKDLFTVYEEVYNSETEEWEVTDEINAYGLTDLFQILIDYPIDNELEDADIFVITHDNIDVEDIFEKYLEANPEDTKSILYYDEDDEDSTDENSVNTNNASVDFWIDIAEQLNKISQSIIKHIKQDL